MSDETVPEVPEKTAEQVSADAVIANFVQRYEKVRSPGISLEFLKSFLQHTAADKIQQDAASTFGGLTVDRMSQLVYAVGEALAKFETEKQAKMAELKAAYEKELEDARAAKEAEKVAEKQAKLDALTAKKAARTAKKVQK